MISNKIYNKTNTCISQKIGFITLLIFNKIFLHVEEWNE